ncbi:DUF3299 domain-containing protein [Roseateles amylovorans]|uniref:DUF3299 domain-containing protein n=1 Tax=Roseateles amylovorans TaxID=2978473 RepID=A0ABY6BAT9_9BURK|nr:DUF3299 domain-containing protein [Roseateles amylovorans]UXH80317.1 DUF3299 domain-containing protein [Roseateles amylovorans]
MTASFPSACCADIRLCLRAAVGAMLVVAGLGAVQAQSSGSAAGQGGAAAVAAIGQGPGYHDPRSPFKPLQEIDGVLSWKLLSSVTTKADKSRVIPSFPAAVQALDKRTVKVQGFMMPLEPGDKQSHFLLSSVPTTCSFCVPAGPEGLVEVRSKSPVRYTLEPVTVEGQLAVLSDDPYGMFYRVTQAVPASVPAR